MTKYLCVPALINILCFMLGCSSGPGHKAELDQDYASAGIQNIQNFPPIKTNPYSQLRKLQDEVFALDDYLYGSEKLGSLGLYGELKTCQQKLASAPYGGSGKLQWSEPLDRIHEEEEVTGFGMEAAPSLTALQLREIEARVRRFEFYRRILRARQTDLSKALQNCKDELSARPYNSSSPPEVQVESLEKVNLQRSQIADFMCSYVKKGTLMSEFLAELFGHGWLALTDLPRDGNLVAAEVRDKAGKPRSNVFLFSGWKLAFDKPNLKLGDVIDGRQIARLTAWTHANKESIPGREQCLPNEAGKWNP